MAWLDEVFIGVVLLSVIVGALRGFVREALSLVVWGFALISALCYGSDVADYLQSVIASSPIREAAGAALLFFGVLLAGGLLILLASWLLRGSGLAPVDRMLGSGFGLVRGVLLVAVMVVVVSGSAASREAWWKRSAIVPRIQPLAKELRGLIPPPWLAYLQSQQALPSRVVVVKPEK